MTLTKIVMDSKNRMFRPICIGLNDGRLFVRFDFWWVGFRVTK